MKTVKSLLLGSAVGFVTVSVGQAADLPVKAKPVEYVKVCSLYGDGFWYIPGTDTCIKIGGFVRYQVAWGAGNQATPKGLWAGNDNNGTLNTRTDLNMLNQWVVGTISVDTRTPTEYGTLRSYFDLGTQSTTVMHFGGYNTPINVTQQVGPGSSGGAAATIGNVGYSGLNYNNESTFVTRSFIQFAGITAGRIRSFFDINSMGPYDFSGNRVQADTAGTGILGIAYTAQLGNGVSASFSLEDTGVVFGGRGNNIMNMSLNNVTFAIPAAAAASTLSYGPGDIVDNSIPFSMDPVAALRIDQAWGYAQLSGALHSDSGGYYGNSQNGAPNAAPTTVGLGYPALTCSGSNCGHPNNMWGWATSAGFTLNNFLGMQGDTAGAQFSYCVGGQAYCNKNSPGGALLLSKGGLAFAEDRDGTYANGTQISLTSFWAVTAFYEHYWNPKWRTAFFGGYNQVNYTAQEQSQICPVVAGGTGLQWNGITFQPGSTCNPNYNFWQVGTRTMWNPHPYLDIGVEVLYSQIDQSNTGTATFSSAALSSGLYTFRNLGEFTGLFRIQRNFLY